VRRSPLSAVAVLYLLLALPSPAAPATAPSVPQPAQSPEPARQALQDAAVRIFVEGAGQRGLCTGWIGWSEEARSAVYTAAHCRQDGARYRVMLGSGDALYATHFTTWDSLDLMALWVPRGRLRALRGWKPLPNGPFHALYVLSERGHTLRLVDVPIPRVYWEIRFENHPAAVALPLHSVPGTSGAPVVDVSDGLLVGMVVGFVTERPEVAAVVPAQSIYDALVASGGSRSTGGGTAPPGQDEGRP
jgi:hypothetical protein